MHYSAWDRRASLQENNKLSIILWRDAVRMTGLCFILVIFGYRVKHVPHCTQPDKKAFIVQQWHILLLSRILIMLGKPYFPQTGAVIFPQMINNHLNLFLEFT